MINLSDTTPAATTGRLNITWQNDASGNVSGSMPLSATSKAAVTSSAGVLTLDVSQNNSFLINVVEDITSMSITNPTDGQEITLLWSQDGTGHAVATASNMLGSFSVSTGAGQQSCYKWTYNLNDDNWYQIGANAM